MDVNNATQELLDLKAQVEKITVEVTTANAAKDAAIAEKTALIATLNEKITALEQAATNAGVLNAAFDTALGNLKGAITTADDLNPDAVVVPAVTDVPVVDVPVTDTPAV